MAGKWGPRIEHVFPIEHGDIPASYVSLPEGTKKGNSGIFFVTSQKGDSEMPFEDFCACWKNPKAIHSSMDFMEVYGII